MTFSDDATQILLEILNLNEGGHCAFSTSLHHIYMYMHSLLFFFPLFADLYVVYRLVSRDRFFCIIDPSDLVFADVAAVVVVVVAAAAAPATLEAAADVATRSDGVAFVLSSFLLLLLLRPWRRSYTPPRSIFVLFVMMLLMKALV